MRVEAEIALHMRHFDIAQAIETLTETLGQSVDRNKLKAVLAEAERQLDKAGQNALDKERRTRAGSVSLSLPKLIEAEAVAKALNLTRLRKLVIWGKDVGIREIDPIDRTPASNRTPLTPEQRLEHKELARRYNLRTETVAGWRRKGSEFFAAKKLEMKRRLLPQEVTDAHARDGEHPMVTSARIRKSVANRNRYVQRKQHKKLGTSAFVRDEAQRRGVSESTIWRELRDVRAAEIEPHIDLESVSRFDSTSVTLSGCVSPDIDDSGAQNIRPLLSTSISDANHTPPKGRTSSLRLTRRLREKLKQWHHEKTGRYVTDSAIRKWRERGELEAKLLAMLDEHASRGNE